MKRLMSMWVAPAVALLLAGCDYDSDNDRDHVPPAGLGALLVDNNTGDDIRVYVNGEQVGQVGDYSDRPFDLAPGLHRVVLDEINGDSTYRDDLDIIEGRLTVLDVSGGNFDSDYDVEIFFD